jgi:hypothetical protein
MLVLPIECNGPMRDCSWCGSRTILPKGLKGGCTLFKAEHLTLLSLLSLLILPLINPPRSGRERPKLAHLGVL